MFLGGVRVGSGGTAIQHYCTVHEKTSNILDCHSVDQRFQQAGPCAQGSQYPHDDK